METELQCEKIDEKFISFMSIKYEKSSDLPRWLFYCAIIWPVLPVDIFKYNADSVTIIMIRYKTHLLTFVFPEDDLYVDNYLGKSEEGYFYSTRPGVYAVNWLKDIQKKEKKSGLHASPSQSKLLPYLVPIVTDTF